jgi:hypothetical protein
MTRCVKGHLNLSGGGVMMWSGGDGGRFGGGDITDINKQQALTEVWIAFKVESSYNTESIFTGLFYNCNKSFVLLMMKIITRNYSRDASNIINYHHVE